jgi:methyltransferase
MADKDAFHRKNERPRNPKRDRPGEPHEPRAKVARSVGTTNLPNPTVSRPFTLSLAVPGSVLARAQNAELQSYLAGQIARAATIVAADEVVVYDDHTVKGLVTAAASGSSAGVAGSGASGVLGGGDPCAVMARLLQYSETPP